MSAWARLLLYSGLALLLSHCAFLSELFSSNEGAVRFYSSVPDECSTSKGLKQKLIKPVHSDEELIRHYGISFLIRFRDGVSPGLYGALYYLDQEENLYCMALPDGRFAVFHNSKIKGKDNILQEICYPLKRCK